MFDDQSTYIKFQSDCKCEDPCSCSSNSCGSCPVGTIAVFNESSQFSGCLSPNDSSLYEIEKHIPANGFIKAYHPVTNKYLGDMSPADYIDFLVSLGEAVTPFPTIGEFNVSTRNDLSVPAPAGATSSSAIVFSIDRISCQESCLVSLSSPPTGITFAAGALSLVIESQDSFISDAIEVDPLVVPGMYQLILVYTACGKNITKPLQLNIV